MSAGHNHSASHTSHASFASASSQEICPDPSVHSRFSREHELQNNASKAALLAAGDRQTSSPTPEHKVNALGPDGKLSSAGAATSLKYAKAQDLPSFPSVGIETQKSGLTAASLANTNFVSPEIIRPESSSSASKAAMLAAKDAGHLEWWQYKPDGTGNSAAAMAMGKNIGPQLDYGYTEDGHKKALLAATMSTRKKDTAPPPVEHAPAYPDSARSGFNALNAASVAHRPSTRTSADYQPMSDRSLEASRIQHAQGVNSSMYGSKPPVALEEEEKKHQAALKAASMVAAKQLYDIEKPHMEKIMAGDAGAKQAHAQQYAAERSVASGDALKMQAMNYLKVQEAAQRLAAERLAKLDPDGVTAYKEHYGYGNQAPKSRFSVRGSRRGRGSRSNDDDDVDSSDDEVQAARIKSQMTKLNQQVSAQDTQKRSQDRQSLMAAAEKSVKARMSTMDEQVFNSTGKMSPAMTTEWEAKARAKAAADSEQRLTNHGKVHIGGGQYMDQSEIDAIAAGRMQPTLDEINETAELQRARDAQVKADAERRAEEERLEKARQAEIKAQQKMVQNDEKARLQAEKDAEKAEQKRLRQEQKDAAQLDKDLEKERKKEDKKMSKQHKEEQAAADQRLQQSKQNKQEADKAHAEEVNYEAEADKARQAELDAAERERLADQRITEAEEEVKRTSTEGGSADFAGERTVINTSTDAERPSEEPEAVSPVTPSTSTKRDSKFRGLFSRMRSSRKDATTTTTTSTSTTGATATAGDTTTATADTTSDISKFQSRPEGPSVELSQRAKGKQPEEAGAADVSSVSSLSVSDAGEKRGRASVVSEDKWSEARDQFEEEPVGGRGSTSSPARGGSKFVEGL